MTKEHQRIDGRHQKLSAFIKKTVNLRLAHSNSELYDISEKQSKIKLLDILSLEDHNLNLVNQIYEELLYCFSETFEPWQAKNYENSLKTSREGKIKKQQADYIEESKIRKNLSTPAYPLFLKIVAEWADDEFLKKEKHQLSDFPAIQTAFFAPKEQDSIAYGLESLWYVQRTKKYRNYGTLLLQWEEALKLQAFQGIQWKEADKKDFFTLWKRRLFNEAYPPQKSLKGRWKEGLAIDRITASKIILYFVDRFIEKPYRLIFGEIACLLWTLIFLSDKAKFTLEQILTISSACLQPCKQKIVFNAQIIDLPPALSTLLSLLRNCNKSEKFLFPHITVDTLPDALRKASTFLKITPEVLSEAFLTPPHLFKNLRLLPWLSNDMMNEKTGISAPGNRLGGFLKRYKIPTQCFIDMPKGIFEE